METTKKKKRRRRRSSRGKRYFTEKHQEAIVEYAQADPENKPEELYREVISPVFTEMIDKIVFTYKFNSLPNIDDLKKECKAHLTTILGKFDPEKGHKAFSYFSIVTKNHFIGEVKKNNKNLKREVEMEELSTERDFEKISVHTSYDDKREKDEFLEKVWEEIDSWKQLELSAEEEKVVEAIKILLDNPEDIEIFNRKAIYLYIREITGLEPKHVSSSLSNIRKRYKEFKKLNFG